MNTELDTRVGELEDQFGDINLIARELLDAVREIVMAPSPATAHERVDATNSESVSLSHSQTPNRTPNAGPGAEGPTMAALAFPLGMPPSFRTRGVCHGSQGIHPYIHTPYTRLASARARLIEAIELKPPDPYTQHLLRIAAAMLEEDEAARLLKDGLRAT